ncbi:DUF3857 domain-containing protein [Chitinophaga horti]|uniref:DUF3857 domain-containing protein n=1 Tax=Chitinophaga horti TaxID=2920382 RepID=A0ABY6IWQ1_9BACT|nr:DUF3857 domain-containing protein [Chitinophaga horti]UYQ91621.1 DUF3857 domain-containing protein [Chitinophaga horti]
MNKLICQLAIFLCFALPVSLHAQTNRHLPSDWEQARMTLTTITDSSLFRDDFTILLHNVTCDFILTPPEEAEGVGYYRQVHRRLRVNTQKGSDSLSSIVLPLLPNETIVFMRARVLRPGEEPVELSGRLQAAGTRQHPTSVLQIDPVPVGGELEYEIKSVVSNDLAGSEYMQAEYPILETKFTLLFPKKYQIRTVSRNGYPDAALTAAKNHRVWEVSTGLIPGKKQHVFNYYQPQLQGIQFSLQKFVTDTDKRKRDTVPYNWQIYGEEQFFKYFFLDKDEFNRLQKEMDTWAFLKQQKPLPLLIYQIEHFIKNKYQVSKFYDFDQLQDISSILRTKQTNEIGITKLMAAAFYMMRIRCQLMMVNDRERYPLDSDIANFSAARNVLLYFPDINQALAPTETSYQLPYYPPAWANIPALIASDTVIDGTSKVRTRFGRSPMPDYTTSGIRNETEIWVNDSSANTLLRSKQSFSGFADAQVKMLLGHLDANSKTSFNSTILLKPERENIVSVQAVNTTWSPVDMNAPFTLNSQYRVPYFVLGEDKTLTVTVGSLLAYQYQPVRGLPPSDQPVELPYPCYFEKKVIVHIPAGYKVKNKADFNVDLTNIDSISGLRLGMLQSGNTVTLLATEWYKQPLITGSSRAAFDRVQKAIAFLRSKNLVLEKE